MDSTWVLIGQQVCFPSVMKRENDVSSVVWPSPNCENLQYVYIVFLFVKTENDFIKEIKHVFRAFIACWKPRQCLWEFSSRWKLICYRILLNVRLGFHQAMKARKTWFISYVICWCYFTFFILCYGLRDVFVWRLLPVK